MKINENLFKSLLKSKTEKEIISLCLNNKNISKIVLKSVIFINIQFLSLESNNIPEIEFLSCFPHLWSLNIKKNPVKIILKKIGNFSVLKAINTLGYLALTVDSYSLNSFISLRKLNIGILEINEEYTFESLYLNKSHNNSVESYLPNHLRFQQSEVKSLMTIIPSKNKLNSKDILLFNNRIIYANKIYLTAEEEGLNISNNKL